MNDGLDNNQLNKILLKPRFKIERGEDKAIIIKKFNDEFAQRGSNFLGKSLRTIKTNEKIITGNFFIRNPLGTSVFPGERLLDHQI